MSPINTLLVDDEYLALNLLEEFAKQVPDLHIVAKVKSPLEALRILQAQRIDLLFLDIQMPALSGNNLLKTLPDPPLTIFTTAYAEYAVEAFELQAVDYLLKPFSFERFLRAVNLARERLSPPPAFAGKDPAPERERPYFTIKTDGKTVKVRFADILLVEGWKEYVRIYCRDGQKLVTLERLKNLEALLPSRFLRVHKSYIVDKEAVRSLEGNLLRVGPHEVPIGRSRREAVLAAIF